MLANNPRASSQIAPVAISAWCLRNSEGIGEGKEFGSVNVVKHAPHFGARMRFLRKTGRSA
jgi:hypothetical protein